LVDESEYGVLAKTIETIFFFLISHMLVGFVTPYGQSL
jgi:hypothetical protein